MLIFTIQVDAPLGSAQGVKEDLADFLEAYGHAKVVSVEEQFPEQLKIDLD